MESKQYNWSARTEKVTKAVYLYRDRYSQSLVCSHLPGQCYARHQDRNQFIKFLSFSPVCPYHNFSEFDALQPLVGRLINTHVDDITYRIGRSRRLSAGLDSMEYEVYSAYKVSHHNLLMQFFFKLYHEERLNRAKKINSATHVIIRAHGKVGELGKFQSLLAMVG